MPYIYYSDFYKLHIHTFEEVEQENLIFFIYGKKSPDFFKQAAL